MTSAPVGIVGYGLLGSACAARLGAAGRPMAGYDPDPASRARMGRDGVPASASLLDLAATCGELLICVYSADQAEAVLAELLAAELAARPRLICLTTVSPTRARALAEAAAKASIEFVELPISGSSQRVAAGGAVALAGGDPAAIERSRATIEAIAPRLVELGPAGTAARAKLAINLVLEINRSALAEGLALAEALGLDLELFSAALLDSSAYSLVMEEKAAMMRDGDFAAAARASQSLKDVRLMLDAGAAAGQELPLAALQAQLLASCVEQGWGDLDGAVVIEELRRRRSTSAAALARGASNG